MPRKSKPETTTVPKPLDPEAVRAICQLKADERLDLQRRINRESERVIKAEQDLNKKRLDADEAKRDAAAALEAHRAYKGRIPDADYEADLKRLTKEKEQTAKTLDETLQKTSAEYAKMRTPMNELQQKADDLNRQWKFHVKRAEEAGIDVDVFWTPEQGVPPEDTPAEE